MSTDTMSNTSVLRSDRRTVTQLLAAAERDTDRVSGPAWEPMSWEEESMAIREAQERRIDQALSLLLDGAEDWWRALDSNEFTHRLESGAVLARLVKAIRAGLAP